MIIIYNQNICASIEESETTSLYQVFLSDEATENLVHLIDENNKYSRKYLTKDQEKSTSDIQVARIEASLKGFELDYHFKVEEQDKDQTILRSEIYKVMLELKGQKVPKSHYAKLLINKTIINLEQSNQYTDK